MATALYRSQAQSRDSNILKNSPRSRRVRMCSLWAYAQAHLGPSPQQNSKENYEDAATQPVPSSKLATVRIGKSVHGNSILGNSVRYFFLCRICPGKLVPSASHLTSSLHRCFLWRQGPRVLHIMTALPQSTIGAVAFAQASVATSDGSWLSSAIRIIRALRDTLSLGIQKCSKRVRT